MSILTASRPTVQTDAALDAEARELVAELRASARVSAPALIADLDESWLVDDVEGFTAYVAECAAAGVRS